LSPSLSCRVSTVSSSGKFLPHCSLAHSSPFDKNRLTIKPPGNSLTRELEKKFSDRHVLVLASRRILPRPKRSSRSRNTQKQKRPRSRTLTAVHDAILTDLVYPVEIVGKRLRTKEDGSKNLKVILDEKERGGVDYRLDTYSEVYRKLTGRGVTFEFPQSTGAEY
jgi:small subunit ribosomal protein S7e